MGKHQTLESKKALTHPYWWLHIHEGVLKDVCFLQLLE